MFESVYLFVVSCLFLTVRSQTGKDLQPQNLSLTWISEFEPRLSWAPQHLTGCSYIVRSNTTIPANSERFRTQKTDTSGWDRRIVMDGGFLQFSVETDCNGNISDPAFYTVTYPELVKSWTCYIYSREQTRCSWTPNSTDVRFYYKLVNLAPDSDDSDSLPIQECPSYSYTKDTRSGCDLQAGYDHKIYILFNGTWNNSVFRNTFEKELKKDVRPPPLNWTVHKTGDNFNITWSPPDIHELLTWKFKINYTECNEIKIQEVPGRSTITWQLERVLHCPYRMSIKAYSEHGQTPWSEEKVFEADRDSNALVFAAVIIPLMFAGLAALTFVCCRTNRETIFPKVPQPRDLLSDISDNNNKSNVCNLYIPVRDEENCKITLVIDPEVKKPDY